MRNTRLFKLLRDLPPEEMGGLRTYLSQKHKRTTQIMRLFNYMDQRHPDFKENEEEWKKEKVYTYVFKKSLFNRGQFQELTYRLLKETEGFLINIEIKEDNTLRDVLLNKAFKKRGMDDLFTLYNDRAKRDILKIETLEEEHYGVLFRLMHDAVFHRNTVKLRPEYYQQLIQMEDYLDMYYILHKVRMLCERTVLSHIIDIDLHNPLISIDFEEVIKQKPNEYLLDLYAQVIEMYEKGDTRIYHELKAKITNKAKPLSSENKHTLTVFLINFCSREYKQNSAEYDKEVFDLFQFANSENLFKEDGFISEISYLSLVKIAAAARQFDYAEKWIEYAKYIKPQYRENGRKLASAILHFSKKEYTKVQTLLHQEVEWRNINYKLTARGLLTKAYYEMADYERLKKHLESARKAIKRDTTLSESHKVANLNFLQMVNELAKYKEKSTSPDEALFSQLHESMVYRQWCRKKLNELTA